MTEPHHDLVALALQELGPAERERVIAHLAVCGTCRADYAAIEDDLRHALAAAPSIAPPAGFSGHVLAAMGMPEPPPPQVLGAAPERNPRRWRMTLAAASAALVVGIGVGAGGMALLDPAEAPPVSSQAGDPTSASALVTGDGAAVGSAGVAVLSGRDYLVISVVRARPGASYECVVVGDDGGRRSAGTWTLDASYGSDASGTWVVELPAGGVARVELVTASGRVWSAAQF